MLLKKHRRNRQSRLSLGPEDYRAAREKCRVQPKGTDTDLL